MFHFDVPGSVAKSTHAGIPWLLYLRSRLGDRVHFWPFDGWQIPKGKSAVVEIYPARWGHGLARDGRNRISRTRTRPLSGFVEAMRTGAWHDF